MNDENIRLTTLSHGGGCGCKIAPGVLDELLRGMLPNVTTERLLVGNDTRDDAAVFAVSENHAIVATTDFFHADRE